jgi:ubiquinone/menaquinone biosynthesis C-methylase UbiE
MMADYDVLASHYDAVTGDSATEAALIRDILVRRHREAATLLDVACGTGAITALLSPAYQVSGLDISPGMLAMARGKLPSGTPLYLADMTSFSLGATFDAIICAYQGVNHLLSLPAWESFFGCVYRHLNAGGVFVFDIATLSYLLTMQNTSKIMQEFAGNYLLIRVQAPNGVVFEWHIEVFELQRDGTYRLLTQIVRMRSFPVEEILAALRRRFFTGIEVIGDEDRVWLACVRPA